MTHESKQNEYDRSVIMIRLQLLLLMILYSYRQRR
jgi:hypothetical protein